MHIQEIRASAGNQWGCPTTDVMCTVTEVHGLQAELLFVDSLTCVQNGKDRLRWKINCFFVLFFERYKNIITTRL